MKTTRHFVVASLLAFSCTWAQAQFVLVVGAKSPIAALTAEQASQLFLGKVSTFPSGETATPLDQPDGAGIRNDFYEKLANKTPKQVSAIRANMVFSGKGKPPKELASSKDVKKAVSENIAAIGYIERAAVDDSVKIVFTQP